MLHGLRTVIYVVPDLAEAKAWYGRTFGIAPYFDEPFYVGFNVGGYELGLMPEEGDHRSGTGGTFAYWGVDDASGALARAVAGGAEVHSDVQDVGEGIRTAIVLDPWGNAVGLIENPHFRPEAAR
jgi:predicted enzyme related to lactoylglutathione lyase